MSAGPTVAVLNILLRQILGPEPDCTRLDLDWIELERGKRALFQAYYHKINGISNSAEVVWEFQADLDIVDSTWVDLTGDGDSELVLGHRRGVQVIDKNRRLLWSKEHLGDAVESVRTVCAIPTSRGRPGRVICFADTFIYVFDPGGHELCKIKAYDQHFVAAQMNDEGERQILRVQLLYADSVANVIALDLDGKELWQHEVDLEVPPGDMIPMLSVDLDLDGTKEWIVPTSPRDLAVINLKGERVASLENPIDPKCPVFTAICDNTVFYVDSDGVRLTAYKLVCGTAGKE